MAISMADVDTLAGDGEDYSSRLYLVVTPLTCLCSS